MRITKTPLKDAFLVELDRLEDDRGFFSRSFCRREFEQAGLNPAVVQCNVSRNRHRGTLRGMHYQLSPFEEAKLVRVTSGAIFDVIIDLRPASPTFTRWFGQELTEENHTALYVPEGFAHGFLTLADNTEVFYQMSNYYSPEHSRGVRYNDPIFGIAWPEPVTNISPKDTSYPDFDRGK
jgi:dTDP-4-dehydrorhamnose 3,5-epimerase